MRQFNLEIDKTSPKTSRFVVPANEHFSILVRYKNWEDKQEWLDYTLVDDAGTDVVKYKKEAENDSALYFCGIMDTSTNLRFKTSTLASTLAPRDTIQVVAIASSTQDNCYICSADYARTTGEGGGGGGGVSEEYVDSKVQEEAVARAAADEALRAEIPTKTSELTNDSGFLTEHQSLSGYYTKTEVDSKVQEEAVARAAADEALRAEIPTKNSQLSNDSGFLTKSDTIDNALSADTAKAAKSVPWSGVTDKPIASATELGLVKIGNNLTIDANGTLNATGGGGGGGGFTEDTTTLSVAFGKVVQNITPKNILSFNTLTWQGNKHQLGGKANVAFDADQSLDDAFWPAKPLPGYIYFKTQLLDNGYVILKDSNNNEIVKNVQTAVIKIPEDGFLLNGIAEQTNNAQFEITNSDSLGATLYEGGFQTAFDTNKYYFITAKSKIAKTSNKLIVVVDSAVSNNFSFSLGDNSGGGKQYIINVNTNNGVFVQSFPLYDKSYIVAYSDCYYSYFGDSQLTPHTGNLHNGDFWLDLGTYKEYGDITLTNVDFNFNS